MQFNADEIRNILPHRYPMLLVDRITDCEPGKFATGIKCVSQNEQFFCGHFPEQSVMPGVLIIEALAQVGAVIALTLPEEKGKLVFFGGIKKARFRQKVVPGDVLTLHVEMTRRMGAVGMATAVAKVGDVVVADAELTFAIG